LIVSIIKSISVLRFDDLSSTSSFEADAVADVIFFLPRRNPCSADCDDEGIMIMDVISEVESIRITYQVVKSVKRNLHESGLPAFASSLVGAEVLVRIVVIVCGRMGAN
jgi:hypothetical protein